MKYLKFGFYALIKSPLFNTLIMLELAAILIIGNLTIAVYNSRSAFYEPYKDILTRDGFVFIGRGQGNYDADLKIKRTLDSLEGDVTVINSYGLQLVTDDVTFIRHIEAIDNGIFTKLNLPLEEGRWASSEKNTNGEIEAVIYKAGDSDDTRLTLGNVIDGTINEKPCKIKIVGIIGNGQYAPVLTNSIRGKSEENSVMNFYELLSDKDEGCRFFVSASADEVLSDPHNIAMTVSFMYYNFEPSADVRQRNKEKIMGISKNISLLSEYNENTLAFINEQYIKLLPILLCVFVIVLAELICSASMNTKRQLRNYGIYFLCGCKWSDCLKFSLAYSLLILAGGVVSGCAAFLIFRKTEYANLFERYIAENNIFTTATIAAVMLLLSLVIPFFMVRRTSPVKTIKEA